MPCLCLLDCLFRLLRRIDSAMTRATQQLALPPPIHHFRVLFRLLVLQQTAAADLAVLRNRSGWPCDRLHQLLRVCVDKPAKRIALRDGLARRPVNLFHQLVVFLLYLHPMLVVIMPWHVASACRLVGHLDSAMA